MDKLNRDFFRALYNETRDIDINNLSINQIVESYDKLSRKYNEFIKLQNGTNNASDSAILKRRFDRLFLFWIDYFNVALRNEIGKIGDQEKEIKTISTGIGDNAILSEDTIKKINTAHVIKLSHEAYNLTALKTIKQILNKITQGGFEKSFMEKEPRSVLDGLLNEVETYSFRTGAGNVIESYIKKYEISFDRDGKKYTQEFYGEIQMARFENDREYRRIVLELIEDLNIQNYYLRKNDKYIGHIAEEDTSWINERRQGDIIAINLIDNMNQELEQRRKSLRKMEESR